MILINIFIHYYISSYSHSPVVFNIILDRTTPTLFFLWISYYLSALDQVFFIESNVECDQVVCGVHRSRRSWQAIIFSSSPILLKKNQEGIDTQI